MNEEETFCFSEEEEEKTMSSKELLSLLETAWLNEKFAPELLHHKIEIVDCMLDQLSAMAKNLEKSKKPNIRVSIHELELERIKFILSSYMRQRLQKVEQFCSVLIEEGKNAENQKMTPNELKFALEYHTSFQNHLLSSAVKLMPKCSQNIDSKEMKLHANPDSYVFMKVLKSIDNVPIDEASDESLDLVEGDQHLVSFKPIKELLKASNISLI